ncbi:hypothetical protein HYZ41_01045 [archaeon]|nr:hypothetical protein [archaeon]
MEEINIGKVFTKNELMKIGFEYTGQNFSNYPIYKLDGSIYLMKPVAGDDNKLEVYLKETKTA